MNVARRAGAAALLAVALTAALAAIPARADAPAGYVSFVRGGAFVERAAGSRNLELNATVRERDRIVTGRGARVAIKLWDGTAVSLGAQTVFVLHSHAARPRGGGASTVLELLRGAFRAVTGFVDSRRGASLRVRTPVATIGVRGTDFWGGFEFSDALDVALLDGGPVTIENGAGRVQIDVPGWGTTVGSADAAPTPPKPWGKGKLERAAAATALQR